MAIDATANQPAATPTVTQSTAIKPATPELVALSNGVLPTDLMVDLIFEDIGGQELINISRNDILNGQSILYTPIKNLTSIYLQYNPQNILSLQDHSATYFKSFPIRFEMKVPDTGTGPNGETVYLDSETGDLVINVINLDQEEQVEVEMLSDASVFNGTMYEVNN
jgi:hypothetical protein